jgi:NADH-ubiquinone oxidoreductase chain 4
MVFSAASVQREVETIYRSILPSSFCTFSRINLFSFYLFFERRLIPTVFLILGWGYQPEHIKAGIYLLFLHIISVSSYIGGYFLCL